MLLSSKMFKKLREMFDYQ